MKYIKNGKKNYLGNSNYKKKYSTAGLFGDSGGGFMQMFQGLLNKNQAGVGNTGTSAAGNIQGLEGIQNILGSSGSGNVNPLSGMLGNFARGFIPDKQQDTMRQGQEIKDTADNLYGEAAKKLDPTGGFVVEGLDILGKAVDDDAECIKDENGNIIKCFDETGVRDLSSNILGLNPVAAAQNVADIGYNVAEDLGVENLGVGNFTLGNALETIGGGRGRKKIFEAVKEQIKQRKNAQSAAQIEKDQNIGQNAYFQNKYNNSINRPNMFGYAKKGGKFHFKNGGLVK
jgi:hypothetical protein